MAQDPMERFMLGKEVVTWRARLAQLAIGLLLLAVERGRWVLRKLKGMWK